MLLLLLLLPLLLHLTTATQITTALAFTLIANVTTPSLDLTPSINHLNLTAVHVGAGLDAAVLTPTGPARVLYLNGTAPQDTGIASDGGLFPYGLRLGSLAAGAQSVGLDVGGVQPGVAISEEGWPQVVGPEEGGFVVCFEVRPVYGRPQYPVRFVRAGGDLPSGCVPVALLAQCAVLGEVPRGAVYDHEGVREVRCLGDVRAVEW
ncbi:hypothetical protein B0H67DRAFT_550256 [Lasiosphaeris hirsuta]|uniref:DUF7907 domain-containing protein n=1 Tax=Lasiosphaeris hirsuta TaxID=260670 RepID=A0AA40AYV4_9PEZI|nr:hypothetical protein B0H67DRAFT_550256 [Lasiosphaeris hirsuta]